MPYTKTTQVTKEGLILENTQLLFAIGERIREDDGSRMQEALVQFINNRRGKDFRYGPNKVQIEFSKTISSTVSIEFLGMENRQLRQLIETEALELARLAEKSPGKWEEFLWVTAKQALGLL